MELKNYQEKAVDDLLNKSWNLLGRRKGTLVFQSPTGSGKTIIIADFLKNLAEKTKQTDISDEKHTLSFVWIAPRDLHKQSKRKLEKYYTDLDNFTLKCKFYRELNERKIDEDEILFLNWESVNKAKKNTIIVEDELENNLGNVIERTIEQGRKIILIVDESHHSVDTKIAKKLIDTFRPHLSIHVSATPLQTGMDGMIPIHIDDVKRDEMIKKSLILNDGFGGSMLGRKIKNDLPENKNLKEWILQKALKKRDDLAKAFKAEQYNTNPLLLVQLPDRMKGASNDPVMDETIAILKKNGITTENGKLAIHLSEQKENIKNIDWDDEKVDIMLFKQAIALGWDCPRAHILVLFREWSNKVFSTQTLGRIMRVPSPDIGYYKNEILNHGYVYTSHAEIETDNGVSKDYISPYTSCRKEDYKQIILPSVYRKRQRDKTRLDPSFVDIFLKQAKNDKLKDKIEIEGQKVIRKIIEETEVEHVDKIKSIKGKGELGTHSADDLQSLFNSFVRENMNLLYPENVSLARVRKAIYEFLEKELGIKYIDLTKSSDQMLNDRTYISDFEKVIAIIISEKNKSHFAAAIQCSIERYKSEKDKAEEFISQPHWQIPESITYGSDYTKENRKKSIMQPFYLSNTSSKIEKDFIDFLENSNEVIWWFKNADHGSMYFAVPYKEGGKQKLFYVDFIVLLKNGQVGLYDPKDGFTLGLAKGKAEGLMLYIVDKKNVRGGIVTMRNNTWRISPNDSSKITQDSLSEWDSLYFE